jgi:general secretion pathway protein A
MYERFFFLKERPFHITPDPRFLYLGRKHGEAMELLSYGIRERKGFILLTGEVGTGKTTLCRALLDKLPEHTESALILNPMLSDVDLLSTIVHDFGLNPAAATPAAHIERLNCFLLELNARGGNAAVIIDEAQNLNRSALEMVRLLSNLETEREKLLQIVLVGQPELREKLKTSQLRQLNQRVIIRYHLDPLDLGETAAYIKNRLDVAGPTGSVEFTADALEAVHRGSGGIPRMINIVCDRALTAAYISEKRVIDKKVLGLALAELETEGYMTGTAGLLAYLEYTPHIAASMFLLALLAGIYWGPFVLGLAGH